MKMRFFIIGNDKGIVIQGFNIFKGIRFIKIEGRLVNEACQLQLLEKIKLFFIYILQVEIF